jgi:hypothetical protein
MMEAWSPDAILPRGFNLTYTSDENSTTCSLEAFVNGGEEETFHKLSTQPTRLDLAPDLDPAA